MQMSHRFWWIPAPCVFWRNHKAIRETIEKHGMDPIKPLWMISTEDSQSRLNTFLVLHPTKQDVGKICRSHNSKIFSSSREVLHLQVLTFRASELRRVHTSCILSKIYIGLFHLNFHGTDCLGNNIIKLFFLLVLFIRAYYIK